MTSSQLLAAQTNIPKGNSLCSLFFSVYSVVGVCSCTVADDGRFLAHLIGTIANRCGYANSFVIKFSKFAEGVALEFLMTRHALDETG